MESYGTHALLTGLIHLANIIKIYPNCSMHDNFLSFLKLNNISLYICVYIYIYISHYVSYFICCYLGYFHILAAVNIGL